MTARFNLDPNTQFNLEYNSNPELPSPEDLRPTKNNADPIHITLGNADLRPGFSQALTLNYSKQKNGSLMRLSIWD
ncbi:outer membrane beta-barrel protein [Puia sp. P3]|uniref:outer membrane beta-barrel protein n=1 Tax=Puia sp. P3 TaxID=3423952 RepID=UPI003D674865